MFYWNVKSGAKQKQQKKMQKFERQRRWIHWLSMENDKLMFWNNENKSKLWHKTEEKSWIRQVEIMNLLNRSHELTGWKTYGIIPRKFIIQTNQIEMIDLNDIVNVTIWQTLFLTA